MACFCNGGRMFKLTFIFIKLFFILLVRMFVCFGELRKTNVASLSSLYIFFNVLVKYSDTKSVTSVFSPTKSIKKKY